MGRICLTQALRDLEGETMTIARPELPPVLQASELDTLEKENVSKYETRGRLCFLKKEFEKDLTLRVVLTGALLHRVEEEDKTITNEDLMERVMLAQRVHEADYFSFTAEQIVMLKKLINRRWAPASFLIVGLAFEMLEPKEEVIPGNGHGPSVEREAVV